MIFDHNGLPKDNGATDYQDSARLAGIMAVFEWPRGVNLQGYLDMGQKPKYVRHPFEESKSDFSRDQAICLMAGMCYSHMPIQVDRRFVDGKDWFSPSQMGHVRRCQGLKAYWYQNLWLWLDVLWACYVKPMAEPNQLLCMLMVADPKYLRFYVKHNKKWKEAILAYWCGWRNEKELAELMITKIRNRVLHG